jgi:hypothetical protein
VEVVNLVISIQASFVPGRSAEISFGMMDRLTAF